MESKSVHEPEAKVMSAKEGLKMFRKSLNFVMIVSISVMLLCRSSHAEISSVEILSNIKIANAKISAGSRPIDLIALIDGSGPFIFQWSLEEGLGELSGNTKEIIQYIPPKDIKEESLVTVNLKVTDEENDQEEAEVKFLIGLPPIEIVFPIWYPFPESFKLTQQSFKNLRNKGIPEDILEKLNFLEGQEFLSKEEFLNAIKKQIGEKQIDRYKEPILEHALFSLISCTTSPDHEDCTISPDHKEITIQGEHSEAFGLTTIFESAIDLSGRNTLEIEVVDIGQSKFRKDESTEGVGDGWMLKVIIPEKPPEKEQILRCLNWPMNKDRQFIFREQGAGTIQYSLKSISENSIPRLGFVFFDAELNGFKIRARLVSK